MDQSVSDKMALFRQTAALMSSGFLLTIIGKPIQILVIGIILSFFSIFFLVAALLQFSEKLNKFTRTVKYLGDNLTLLFIIIGLSSIMLQWGEIKKATIIGNLSEATTTQWLESARRSIISSELFIWLIALFWIIFILVFFIEAIKHTKDTCRKLGVRHTIFIYVADILLVLSVYSISRFTDFSSIVDCSLFIFSILVMAGMIFYLYRQSSSLGRLSMGNKEKARESAILVSNMAELIGNLLMLDYPQEILKGVLNVPLKQLEDKLDELKVYVNTLK